MLTRCPQCDTLFRVGSDQLRARDGLVRCGRCLKVFKAEEYAYDVPVDTQEPITEEPFVDEEAESIILSSDDTALTEIITEQVHTNPSSQQDFKDSGTDLPTLAELLWGKKRSRTRPIIWFFANLVLLSILLAQVTWFFATELSRYPQAEPWIQTFCEYAGCVVLPQRDIGLIELSRTRVTQHPRYENVLQVKGSLVNRAPYSQDFPLIEVSLSNRRGETIARRAFVKKNFLTKQNIDEQQMLPNVRFPIEIDFINPEPSATGFEVRLVAPPLPKNTTPNFLKFLDK
jgi:predicted Zn finger-like uncharacterized protein